MPKLQENTTWMIKILITIRMNKKIRKVQTYQVKVLTCKYKISR